MMEVLLLCTLLLAALLFLDCTALAPVLGQECPNFSLLMMTASVLQRAMIWDSCTRLRVWAVHWHVVHIYPVWFEAAEEMASRFWGLMWVFLTVQCRCTDD